MNLTQHIGIVLTTINGGEIITNLADNVLTHGHEKQVTIYAIPDVSTPAQFFETCRYAEERGIRVIYPTMHEQKTFLRQFPVCPPIPERTDNRRNVGFLLALRDHTDVVLSLDDDNFFDAETDALAEHATRLSDAANAVTVTESPTRFWNCCESLPFQVSHPVYPRGFPLAMRHSQTDTVTKDVTCPTWINAGLWLEAPDIDAFLWLAGGKTLRCSEWQAHDVRLGLQTWCPVNSQNTAIAKALIPAYYYLPMQSASLEMPIDRYGDILSGYFALKCAKVHGATANFGGPVARHIRNAHDYASDFRREMLCLSIIDEFLEWLLAVELAKDTMVETYADLARHLDEQVPAFRGRTWTPGLRAHFRFMAACMLQWTQALAQLGIR